LTKKAALNKQERL